AVAQRSGQGINDVNGVVEEQAVSKLSLGRPRLAFALIDGGRELGVGVVAEVNQIEGMAPGAGFFAAAGAGQAAHCAGDNESSIFPADQVQSFEGLVNEIEGMAAVGVVAVG